MEWKEHKWRITRVEEERMRTVKKGHRKEALTSDNRQCFQFRSIGCQVGQLMSQYDPGRGADPQEILTCQQGSHTQTGCLMLADDVVAACVVVVIVQQK
jgi:hypothetical protein